MINKNKVKELYEKGYNPKEIAKFLDYNDRAVSKSIERNCKESKNQHEVSLTERKNMKRELNKILTKENNRYMSTDQLVKQNIQSYNNKNGKLIFDTSRGAIPFDMPKTYLFKA